MLCSLSDTLTRNNNEMMENMMKMFAASRHESPGREEALRDDIDTEIGASTKQTSELAAQVKHLTKTMSPMRAQLDTNTFSVDAIHQVRAELRSEL